jgi:prepilin-type N-terminal cleavage/methylation domain-containing protein
MKAAGFSLVEVLVATAVLTVGVASLAQLFTVSARANRIAKATTMTLLLAQQKAEELRADAAVSSPSPPETLSANTPGHFEYIDRIGMALDGQPPTPPAGAVYVRRWAVEPLEGLEWTSGGAGYAIVLKVLVFDLSSGGHAGDGVAPGETRLATVKTRKAG